MCPEPHPTDGQAKGRRGAALPALLAATCAGLGGTTTPLLADVEFAPEAEVRHYRIGNVALVGNGESDAITQIRLRLALEGKGPKSKYTLAYTPIREMYSKTNDLDNTAHFLFATWDRELSRKSTLSLTADGSRSQLQGIQPENPDRPTTFIPRTTLDRFSLRFGGRAGTGHRSFVSWETGGDLVRYKQPSCVDPRFCLEDNQSVLAALTWGYEVSRSAALGLRYGYQDISFDMREGTGTHTLQLYASRKFGEHTTGDLRVGASRSETGNESRTDPSVDATLRRVLTDRSSLALGARQGISPGNGLTTATLDRGGYASWEFTSATGRLSAAISAADWQRKSVVKTAPDETKTLSTSEDLAFRTGGHWYLGLFHGYTKQSGSGALASLRASYHLAGVFVRWVGRPPVRTPESEGGGAKHSRSLDRRSAARPSDGGRHPLAPWQTRSSPAP